MVKSPVTVEPWQPVAHARQLMLMHSFSFLPVRHEDQWCLLSELALARFLRTSQNIKKERLGLSIEAAARQTPGLDLTCVASENLLTAQTGIDEVLFGNRVAEGSTLWLVVNEHREDHLAGVLSPFELM